MASVDTLISGAELRAIQYSSSVYATVSDLQNFISSYTVPDIAADTKLTIGANVPVYTNPGPESSQLPTYTDPAGVLPPAPTLQDLGTLSTVPTRIAPTLNTAGLFTQTAPSANLPDFNESEPDISVDQLVAEMAALTTPVLDTIVFPEISSFSLAPPPALNLPVFDAPPLPDSIGDPSDYAARLDSSYHQMAPEMQAFIDDRMRSWVEQFAPEYTPWVTQLQARITNGMDGTVLPDQFEAALYTRARGRVEREFDATEQTILETFSKSGFIEPPGTVLSGMLTTRLKNAAALADQSTDIYIDRKKVEVQHLHFSLGLASTQVQSVRNSAIAYAQVVSGSLQLAASYANNISEKVAKVYEHLLARQQMTIAIVNAVGTQYELKLKAALSALEGYKIELEMEQLKTNIEVAKVQAVELKIKAEELGIQRYTALVDAITKKGALEELKLKGYSIRADVFKARTQAAVAGFEVYKASIDGDRAKLEGELGKVSLFEGQLKSDSLQLEMNAKQIEAISLANQSRTANFQAQAEAYKIGLEVAIQRFTAQAEVKKLAVQIHGQELANSVEVFKGQTQAYAILQEAVIKEYTARMQVAIEKLKVEVSKLQIAESASASIVNAFEGMASSALGSLNSMVSSATSA